jgi:Domain of unknown function (DUF4397)
VLVPPIRRRLGLFAVVILAALGLSLVDAAPAAAAGVGYVRLAHLSPDTPDVDVYLSAANGAIKQQVFTGVGYGVVSAYEALPVGTYAVAMRVSGAAATTKPVLSTVVTVTSGRAYTVAGVGMHAQLGLKVLDDDLAIPSGPEKSKIRIIQASIKQPLLNVSLTSGATIANDVQFATTTDYKLVDPGSWTVNVQPADGGSATTLAATVSAGHVYSLLVLDGDGGLTTKLLSDASRNGALPVLGVETGDGGTAPLPALPAIIGAVVLLSIGAGAVGLRVRRGRLRQT